MNNITEKQTEITKRSQPQADFPLTLPAYKASFATKLTVFIWLVLVIFAEIITMFIGILPGVIVYSVILVAVVNLSYFSKSAPARRLYLALTLPSLLRILSLAMPVQLVTLLYRYAMIGIPLALATGLVIIFNGLPGLRSNLTRSEWKSQIAIAATGIPLGIIAYWALPQPPDVMSINTWYLIFLQLIAITIFGAVMEEIIFHGLIQKALNYPFGSLSFIFSSILYASMFLGAHSIGFVIFYGLTGLLFAYWVQARDSLWGAIAAHSLMNIMVLLIYYLH